MQLTVKQICNIAVTCPKGWEGGLDRCYYFSTQHDSVAGNWSHANDLCMGLDPAARLTPIHDSAENTYIMERVFANTTWIGATDGDEEGVWR